MTTSHNASKCYIAAPSACQCRRYHVAWRDSVAARAWLCTSFEKKSAGRQGQRRLWLCYTCSLNVHTGTFANVVKDKFQGGAAIHI